MRVLADGFGKALAPAEPSAVFFRQEWRIYRKMVDDNYLFHREAYGRLKSILAERAPWPFRFLEAKTTALLRTCSASIAFADSPAMLD